MIEVCENCIEDEAYDQDHSGCRANEATCIDGRNCPDFVKECGCKKCWGKEHNGLP